MRMRVIGLLSVMVFALVSGAWAQDAVKNSGDFRIGLEMQHFAYEEPGVMEEAGVLLGVSGSFTHDTPRGLMVQVFGSIVAGDLEYDGGILHEDGTTTPIELTTPNSIFNLRAIAGIDLGTITPYVGLGYRFLIDDLEEASPQLGYTREQKYVYMPIGAELALPVPVGSWRCALRMEYDYFLEGENDSHGGALGRHFVMQQDSGYGIRSSARLLAPENGFAHGRGVTFCLEPYFEYWNIDDSEVVDGSMEPKNNSTTVGFRVSGQF